jgi:hypothetical protein
MRETVHTAWAALVLLGALGCGGPAGSATDAADVGMDLPDGGNDADSGPFTPAAPQAPAPPVFDDWLCPDGWQSGPWTDVTEHGVCRPPAVASCQPGTFAVAGMPACVRQGPQCPDSSWHEEAAIRARVPEFGGRVWYVAPTGDDGAQGSRDAPFLTVVAAMRASTSGDIIALGRGEYDAAVAIRRRLAIIGACVEGTTIAPSEPSVADPVLQSTRDDTVIVADLTLRGDRGGVWMREPGTIHLRGVAVRETVLAGVAAAGLSSRITLEDSLVASTRGRPSDSSLGYGLDVESGGQLEASRSQVSANHDVGIVALGAGTHVILHDVIVNDTQPDQRDLSGGRGVSLDQGATLEFERLVVVGNHAMGVFATGGSLVNGIDLAVRGTRPRQSDMTLGCALSSQGGAQVEVERAVLEGSHEVAVLALDQDTSLRLRRAVVTGTLPAARDATRGAGIAVQRGAEVSLREVTIHRNHSLGLFVALSASLVLEDVRVTETMPQSSDGDFGRGLHVGEGSQVTGHRVALARNHDVGILAFGLGTVVTLEDVAVTDTQPQRSDMSAGRGLDLSGGASATLTRASFLGNHSVGVVAFDNGTSLTLTDVQISGTLPRPADRTVGRGLSVQQGAHASVTRGLFDANHEVGVVAFDPGTELIMRDITVRDTVPTPCNPDELLPTCEGFLGSGIATLEASLRIEDFLITGSDLAGLQILAVPVFHAERGEIRGNRIGLNIQDADLDLAASFDKVRTYDNDEDRAFDDVPVPTAGGILQDLGGQPP